MEIQTGSLFFGGGGEVLKKENGRVGWLKVGIHLYEISRSLFKQSRNPSPITQFFVLGFLVNFWLIFGYKELIKLAEIRNIGNLT